MNWFQRILNKFLGYEYTTVFCRRGYANVVRLYTLPNGNQAVYCFMALRQQILLPTGELSGEKKYVGDFVRWGKL